MGGRAVGRDGGSIIASDITRALLRLERTMNSFCH